MLGNICIFIAVLLLCGGESSLRANYTHYNDFVTWQEAQAECRKKRSDLLSIRSPADSEAFLSVPGWIGLSRRGPYDGWKWSRGDEEAAYTQWSPDHPKPSYNCAFKYSKENVWTSEGCEVLHSYTCSNETLVLVRENKTWEEALEHCRGRYGSTLATLLSPDDHDYARGRAQPATTDEVWTGLRYLGDQWMWVSGAQVGYSDIPSCPAARCGAFQKNENKSFKIRACDERKNFFCM